MNRDTDRSKMFGRRAAVLGFAKLGLLGVLAGRMYYLQVIEGSRYATLADENRINIRLLPPPRGRILDRFGLPLAENETNYRALIVAEDTGKAGGMKATLDRLAKIVDISPKEIQRVMREAKRRRSFVPIKVVENLTWEDVASIQVNSPDLPGVDIDVGQSRNYPHGETLAHVLGYVAQVSEKDLTGDPLLELPGFRIGKAGVEKVHDLALRGAGGTSQVEVNALGRIKRELERKEGEPGAEVHLTIDLDLQRYVEQRVGDESAAAVVLDVHTGEILAMASQPGFDPNAFNKGLSSAYWRELVGNEKSPLINKALVGQYPPGSTFKMVVALAALEAGVISPDQTVFCNGHTELGNARFHCWKKWGHGHMDMHGAIQQSCDVYFYEIAKRLGIDRIAEMARRFGLGEAPDLDLPGARAGTIPTRDWKLATIGRNWQKGETLIAGIGQGYVLTTPLQLAVMTARLVNGGMAVEPRLTKSVGGREIEQAPPEAIDVSASSLKHIMESMSAVVNSPKGTAKGSRIEEESMAMGGKTGTAQVRRISKAERDTRVLKNEELEWRERDHALFVGYAPVNSPRFAVAVVVEHGGSGSTAAAPIARDILYEVQQRNLSTPTVSRYGNDGPETADSGIQRDTAL
jgi:penicillin-binding protein 2